jgi:peptidyl-prolyl cis-trans isomerase SurA
LAPVPEARGEIVDGVAAIVNDDIITLSEVDEAGGPIYREIRRRYGDESMPEIARARKEILDQLVNQKLMEQMIARYDISASDLEVNTAIEDVKRQNDITQAELEEALKREGITREEYRNQVRKQIQRTKLMHRQVRTPSRFSDEDARTYYQNHPETFEMRQQVLVRHILIPTMPNASQEEVATARKKSQKALAQINGGADMGALAKKVSAGPTASEGGSLGWIQRGDTVPDFEEAIFSLKKGETSGIVKTNIGFHIIRVEDEKSARKVPFDEVKSGIKRRMAQEEIEDEFEEWLEKLRQNAYIERKL